MHKLKYFFGAKWQYNILRKNKHLILAHKNSIYHRKSLSTNNLKCTKLIVLYELKCINVYCNNQLSTHFANPLNIFYYRKTMVLELFI